MVVSLQINNSGYLFILTNQIPKGRSIVFEPMVDYPQAYKVAAPDVLFLSMSSDAGEKRNAFGYYS